MEPTEAALSFILGLERMDATINLGGTMSSDNTINDAGKRLKAYRLASILIISIGVVLMIIKIYADSEPGGIPILLVLLGTVLYLITWYRLRSHRG